MILRLGKHMIRILPSMQGTSGMPLPQLTLTYSMFISGELIIGWKTFCQDGRALLIHYIYYMHMLRNQYGYLYLTKC